ncbi:hypothetical protein [Chitinophaga sp. Cy-1792]|uniref:hypothetical protein n=1 Tax=Chitinophaga sp. Cy-1792 TaxID=2608339 RepID=UPI001420827F|nr:hypothetical protein [Chitinophaga sp. Cy-1792]NIG54901.1 hypothetical protein [Chitinophaga sp. Cy-1792]
MQEPSKKDYKNVCQTHQERIAHLKYEFYRMYFKAKGFENVDFIVHPSEFIIPATPTSILQEPGQTK